MSEELEGRLDELEQVAFDLAEALLSARTWDDNIGLGHVNGNDGWPPELEQEAGEALDAYRAYEANHEDYAPPPAFFEVCDGFEAEVSG